MKHELKTLSPHFWAVVHSRKRQELRRADRDYKVGDLLLLKEWNGKEYTGWDTTVRVTHILRGPLYGLKSGWVIMSIILE